jgi:hypothetical protein
MTFNRADHTSEIIENLRISNRQMQRDIDLLEFEMRYWKTQIETIQNVIDSNDALINKEYEFLRSNEEI